MGADVMNSTVSVWHEQATENAFGDEIDTELGDPDLARVPILIEEKSRTVRNPESLEVSTVTWWTGETKPHRDIRVGDRLRDERTGEVYFVDSRRIPKARTGARALLLTMRATAAG
jgi:hypothetical protein